MSVRTGVCWIAITAGAMTGAAQTKQASAPARQPDLPLVQLVVTTFEGVLPCADCSGLRVTLTLSAPSIGNAGAGTFTLKETYIGRNVTNDSMGRWEMTTGSAKDPNATVYRLTFENAGSEQYWLKVSDNELRALDRERREIASPKPQVLKRISPPPAVTPPPGAYRPAYVGDATIRAAAAFAVAQQAATTPGISLSAVRSADSQVVAGTNYRLCLSVIRNGRTEPAQAVVFRDLKTQMFLTSWTWGACGK